MVVSQSLCGLYIFYKICAQCVTCSSYKLYMCRCLTNIVWENLRSKVTPFALMVLTKLIRIYVCQKWELLWVVNVGVSHQPCYRGSTGSEKVWKSQNYNIHFFSFSFLLLFSRFLLDRLHNSSSTPQCHFYEHVYKPRLHYLVVLINVSSYHFHVRGKLTVSSINQNVSKDWFP